MIYLPVYKSIFQFKRNYSGAQATGKDAIPKVDTVGELVEKRDEKDDMG